MIIPVIVHDCLTKAVYSPASDPVKAVLDIWLSGDLSPGMHRKFSGPILTDVLNKYR